jgi:hypothetical protein
MRSPHRQPKVTRSPQGLARTPHSPCGVHTDTWGSVNYCQLRTSTHSPQTPRTRSASQRPPYRPHTRPQRVRYPPRENQTSHVTATQRDRFRATTHVAPTVPPQYIPPAHRHDTGSPHRSFQQNLWSQNFRRDPPPHKYTPTHSPKPSDSLNWHAPSPNRPATFRSLSPPLHPPSTPSASPYPPEIPPAALQHHPESQLGSELISLIKATSDALRGIALVVEKLVRWVNAERQLAHKPR